MTETYVWVNINIITFAQGLGPYTEILVKSVAPSLLSTSVTPVRTTSWRLDMGTGYDCFDSMAHLMASRLTGQQRANRMLLALPMAQAGFAGWRYEWWHFTLRDELYPNTYFDFPAR
jgi:D-alanyl-D-alanine dipeptidase